MLREFSKECMVERRIGGLTFGAGHIKQRFRPGYGGKHNRHHERSRRGYSFGDSVSRSGWHGTAFAATFANAASPEATRRERCATYCVSGYDCER